MFWLIVGLGTLALLVSVVVFALAVSRETGRLEERVKRLHEDAASQQKKAEVMAESREPEDAIDRLDRGTF